MIPPVAAAGVPLTTPVVPFKVRPAGKLGKVKVGAGKPVAVSVKVQAVPTVQLAVAGDVNAGA